MADWCVSLKDARVTLKDDKLHDQDGNSSYIRLRFDEKDIFIKSLDSIRSAVGQTPKNDIQTLTPISLNSDVQSTLVDVDVS